MRERERIRSSSGVGRVAGAMKGSSLSVWEVLGGVVVVRHGNRGLRGKRGLPEG